MRRFILAALALVIFVVSVVVLHIVSLFVVAAVLEGSCGDNCYTTVYLGPGFVIVTLVAAIAIAAGAVRYAAGKMTRR
jgi:ABC-type sugar transport system permease subunit